MEIVSGCVIKRNNKILMVKEAKKICYGKYNFPAGHVDENELIDAVHTALDKGISFFDTADTYGLGESEKTLGKVLKVLED